MNHGWHGEVIMNWNVRLLRHTLGCWWRINKLVACWTNIPRDAYSITCIFEWKFGTEWSTGFKGVGNSKWGTLPFCYLPYGFFQLTSQTHYPQYKTGSPCGKKPHCLVFWQTLNILLRLTNKQQWHQYHGFFITDTSMEAILHALSNPQVIKTRYNLVGKPICFTAGDCCNVEKWGIWEWHM